MAVTAKFVADFSSFNQAIDRALGNLDKFKKGAEGAEKSLGRMVDNFSGQKMIREAISMAAAVEAVGGKAVLTSKELEHVGNTAKEAADKLKLLGKDVPANLQELAKHASSSTKELSLMDRVLGSIGPKLIATFSAGAIIAAIKNTGQWAGEINDLAAKFGITTEAVQRFDFAARQNGASIDQVGTAMQKLSKSLVEGGGASAKALERLGLSFEDLRTKSPDEALRLVGREIVALQSPTEQLATSQQLLGKGGADLIPMFKNLEKDMGRAVVVSDSMIKAGDSLGDSFDSMLGTGKALLAGVLAPMAPALDSAATAAASFAREQLRIAEATNNVTKALQEQGQFLPSSQGGFKDAPSPVAAQIEAELQRLQRAEMEAQARGGLKGGFGAGGALQTGSIDVMETQMRRLEVAHEKTAAATQAAAVAAKQLAEDVKRLGKEYDAWITKTRNAEGEALMKQAAERFSGVQDAVDAGRLAIVGAVPQLAAVGAVGKTATDELERMAQALYNLPPALKSAGDSAGVAMGGGGGIFGGLKGGLSGMLQDFTGGKGISGIFSKLGTGLFEGFGNILSGGLSSLINSGIGLLGKGLGKLFGGLFGGEGKKVNDMRDQFIAAAGGIDVLAAKAQAAGTSVDKLLAAKKVKDFEKAVQDLEGTLGRFADQTEKDQLRLQEAIEKYGFTLAELGPMLQKQKLDTQATDLAEDWRVLMAAGVDVNAINERMEESVMAYLDAAKSVGAEVPASMRPVLQSMIDTGTLTDEAGKAFESLDAAGITFASTLTDVVDKLDELIDKLGELGSMPNINVGMPTIPEGGFAGGTGGRYLNFGRGTPVMLHGRERVSTEAEGRAEASGLSSLAASMDAIRRDFATFPELMRDALQTRVVVAH